MAEYGIISSAILQDVADAIREKSGETATMYPADFPYAIRQLSVGGGAVAAGPGGPSDVNFWDYDGTLVAAYTLEEAQALTALPSPPATDGLSFAGWNWTLNEVRALTYPMDVGALYVPTDGATHLYIQPDGYGPITLSYKQSAADGVTIDWGDGSETYTASLAGGVQATHEFTGGKTLYDVTLTVNSGTVTLGYSSAGSAPILSDQAALRALFCGRGVTALATSALAGAYGATWVTLGTELETMARLTLDNCITVSSVALPRTLTTIPSTVAGYYGYGPRMVQFSPLAAEIGSSAFAGAYHMRYGVPPAGCAIGSSAMRYAQSRAIACGGDLSGNTYIAANNSALQVAHLAAGTILGANAFNACYGLKKITGGSYSVAGAAAFYDCRSLEDVGNLTGDLPQNALYRCMSIRTLTLPADCSSVGNSALNGLYNLATITVPAAVASIGTYFCASCNSLHRITMLGSTPPTLGANALNSVNLPDEFEILVPAASLATYQSATNWSAFADYMVGY